MEILDQIQNILETITNGTLGEVSEIAAIAASAGLSAVLMWKKIIKPSYETIKLISHKYQEIADKMKVLDELKPNGGSSIKDTLNRLESKMTKNEYINNIIIGNMGIAYFITDHDGFITEVGKELCRILGKQQEDIINRNWISLTDSPNTVHSQWQYAVDNHLDFNMTVNITKDDGSTYPVGVQAHQMFKLSSRIGYWGIMRLL